jgi:hypothetical protein
MAHRGGRGAHYRWEALMPIQPNAEMSRGPGPAPASPAAVNLASASPVPVSAVPVSAVPVSAVPVNLLPLGADGRPLSRRGAQPPHRPGAQSFRPALTRAPVMTRAGMSAADRPEPRSAERPEPRSGAIRRIAQEHKLFCAVLLVATLVRVIAMLGYSPALWYPDSMPYVHAAMHVAPYQIRPVGYSFMLLALKPFHSFTLVVVAQHAMGIAAGIAIYALLRRRFRMPAWAATLAAVPPLLSAYTIQIEHFILSDTLFGFLVTMAVVLMLWRPVPPVWICALAGLLLSVAAVVRSEGLPLMVPFLVFLALQLRNIRVIAGILAMCITFALPVLAYEQWFDRTYGYFGETTSTGAFLYGRVSTFADCSIIKPPADERWLCLSQPPSQRTQSPDYYVWSPNSPIQHEPGSEPGPVSEFSNTVNHLATDFDRRAIMAQPLDYLKAVLYSTFQSFRANSTQNQYLFPAHVPESLQAIAARNDENYRDAYNYNRGAPSTRLVAPFVAMTRFYQRFAVLSGWLLAIIVLAGLTGMASAWRHGRRPRPIEHRLGRPTLLPWLTGFVLLASPAATAGFSSRYVVASVPVFCIAAALGLKQLADSFHTRSSEVLPASQPAPHPQALAGPPPPYAQALAGPPPYAQALAGPPPYAQALAGPPPPHPQARAGQPAPHLTAHAPQPASNLQVRIEQPAPRAQALTAQPALYPAVRTEQQAPHPQAVEQSAPQPHPHALAERTVAVVGRGLQRLDGPVTVEHGTSVLPQRPVRHFPQNGQIANGSRSAPIITDGYPTKSGG